MRQSLPISNFLLRQCAELRQIQWYVLPPPLTQVVGEADRIQLKHLFTLQEGVSENQYDKMKTKGVCLVVPRSLHSTYPPSVRAELLSLEDFVNETKGF